MASSRANETVVITGAPAGWARKSNCTRVWASRRPSRIWLSGQATPATSCGQIQIAPGQLQYLSL